MSFPNNGMPNWPNQNVYNNQSQGQYPSPQYNPAPYYGNLPVPNPNMSYNTNVSQSVNRPNNTQQNLGLLGRTVNNESEIRPDEVPMNGSVAFFPQADGSCIYAKFWNNNGLIEKRVFVLASQEDPSAVPASNVNLGDMYKELSTKLDDISKMLKRNNRPYRDNRPKYNNQPVNEEENKNV